jgi:two-component system sensor histidine kinase BaeS
LGWTASAHAGQAQQQGVSLQVEANRNLPEVEIDPDRMAQVLGNLVSNALLYTPVGGKILLSAYFRPDCIDGHSPTLYLCVRDTGEGIAPEDLPHIFQRFYRGDNSRYRKEDESGEELHDEMLPYWIIRTRSIAGCL